MKTITKLQDQALLDINGGERRHSESEKESEIDAKKAKRSGCDRGPGTVQMDGIPV